MTLTAVTTREVTAPRFEAGEKLGRESAHIVRHLGQDVYLVRYADGHEAAAFEHEIKQTPASRERRPSPFAWRRSSKKVPA